MLRDPLSSKDPYPPSQHRPFAGGMASRRGRGLMDPREIAHLSPSSAAEGMGGKRSLERPFLPHPLLAPNPFFEGLQRQLLQGGEKKKGKQEFVRFPAPRTLRSPPLPSQGPLPPLLCKSRRFQTHFGRKGGGGRKGRWERRGLSSSPIPFADGPISCLAVFELKRNAGVSKQRRTFPTQSAVSVRESIVSLQYCRSPLFRKKIAAPSSDLFLSPFLSFPPFSSVS